jgi:hypothetical protein
MSDLVIAGSVGVGIILAGVAARMFLKAKDDNVYNSTYTANITGQNPQSYSSHLYNSQGTLTHSIGPSISSTIGGRRSSKSTRKLRKSKRK